MEKNAALEILVALLAAYRQAKGTKKRRRVLLGRTRLNYDSFWATTSKGLTSGR